MIARIWRGETRREEAAEYMSVLRETGIRDYRAIDEVEHLDCMLADMDELHGDQ